jgi:FAD/FMN-containing dehydrogenase
VKWATSRGIKFLARAGGHGWSTTLSEIGSEDIVINLRALNKVQVDQKAGTATLGAGATTGELLKAAQDGGVHIGMTVTQILLDTAPIDVFDSCYCL